MANKQDLLDSFHEAWSLDRLTKMTLQEYTNLEKSDLFCYWIEAKLSDFGSIWGPSSFI